MIVLPGGVAALAAGPRNEAAPRSIVARRSVILRTVRCERTCRDSDNHVDECWCVTSYMECSARKYSRNSIISNSDISPSNTENFSDVSLNLVAVSTSNYRNNPDPTLISGARGDQAKFRSAVLTV